MSCREEQGRSNDRRPRDDSSAQKPSQNKTTKDDLFTDGSGDQQVNPQRGMGKRPSIQRKLVISRGGNGKEEQEEIRPERRDQEDDEDGNQREQQQQER